MDYLANGSVLKDVKMEKRKLFSLHFIRGILQTTDMGGSI